MNQDEARINVMQKLDENTTLLVLDWAMKYLPRKFRESQSDWFGKRGIPWHITVAIRKSKDGEIEILTFAHIFESCSQDSSSVLAIVDNVFQQLSTVTPKIKTVYMRADNAGCYHAALTLLSMRKIAAKHNITLSRIDFSDPQGGKGSCDRKATTIKNKMRIYVNSGHDVESPQQMLEAIESMGGIPGLSVTLCGKHPAQTSDVKWQGISFLNNFAYEKNGIRVWRAYETGSGKVLQWSDLDQTTQPQPGIDIIGESTTKATFVRVKARKAKSTTKSSKEGQENDQSDNNSDNNADGLASTELFMCPEEGCIKSYQRYTSLERHLDVGKHSYALELETFFDKAAMAYAEKLEQGASCLLHSVDLPSDNYSSVDLPLDESIGCSYFNDSISPSELLPPCEPEQAQKLALNMGWALKTSSKKKRLTEDQKKYLMELFQIGEQTGQKVNPDAASKSLRKAKNADGSRIFGTDEFLTPKQVASFFSRLAAKRAIPDDLDTLEEDTEMAKDVIEAERENVMSNLEVEVLDALSIRHPITYNNLNICCIVRSQRSKLERLSIAVLDDICQAYDLHKPDKGKRKLKKPLIDSIVRFASNCSCMQ